MAAYMYGQSVETRASSCVRIVSLRAPVRVPLIDTLDNHVGALGLAGDLAVAEKSPAKVASAVRKTTLTGGVHCKRHSPSLLFFYSKS